MSTDAGHPDNAALADFDGGVLDADQAATISAHIAACQSCAQRVQAFDATRRDLHELANPPVPDQYANRISAALRSEVAARPVKPRLLARWHGGAAALAAAAVVVLFVVGAVVVWGESSPSHQEAAKRSTGAAPGSAGATRIESTRRDYTARTMSSDVAMLLTTSSPVSGGLAATPSPASAPQESAAQTDALSTALQSYRNPAFLQRCLLSLEAGPTALAVDVAYYNNQASAVIVVPAPSHTDRLDVFVVPTNCDPNQVKFFRVPRP